MNPNLEACQKCEVQGELDNRVNGAIEVFSFEDLTVSQGRERLSTALLWGVRNHCPQSEIQASKRAGLEVIDPAHANVRNSYPGTPSADNDSLPRRSSYEGPLGRRGSNI